LPDFVDVWHRMKKIYILSQICRLLRLLVERYLIAASIIIPFVLLLLQIACEVNEIFCDIIGETKWKIWNVGDVHHEEKAGFSLSLLTRAYT
jgi:hypothetical protein